MPLIRILLNLSTRPPAAWTPPPALSPTAPTTGSCCGDPTTQTSRPPR